MCLIDFGHWKYWINSVVIIMNFYVWYLNNEHFVIYSHLFNMNLSLFFYHSSALLHIICIHFYFIHQHFYSIILNCYSICVLVINSLFINCFFILLLMTNDICTYSISIYYIPLTSYHPYHHFYSLPLPIVSTPTLLSVSVFTFAKIVINSITIIS